MNLKEKIVAFLIIVIAGSMLQVSAQKATRQSAAEAFSGGNFEKAYSEYSELLSLYPRDPVYKYFSAACLVKLEKNPAEAGRLIEEALKSGSLKSLPDDAVFYLARVQQMQGSFREAEKTFGRFTAEAGKKKARELNVPEYVQQCKEGRGKVDEANAVAEVKKAEPAATPKPEAVLKQPLPQEIDNSLGQKLETQYKADSVEATMTAAKQQAVAVPEPVKPAQVQEQVANAVSVPVQAEIAADSGKAKNIFTPAPAPVASAEATGIADTSIKLREILTRTTAVYSVFEVLPQPVTDPKATIEINPQSPEGLVYRIQTAVFRNPVQLAYFKGISPIYGMKGAGATVTTYYAGMFRKSADAAKALASVKAKGFKDSFVVGQVSNKSVSSERASILEKEWGDKPLFNTETSETTRNLDTIPPTLVLKVEVARSIQPLKEEAIEPMRRMAGKRSFDMFTLENGSIAYLIGNFITFESAGDFAGLLQRNGYRDAKVVAWLGKREIDIQTAKQLFETLK